MSITWFFSIVSHLPGIHLYVVFPFPQYFPANTSKRGFWQLLFFIVIFFHFSMWIVYIFTNLKNHDTSKRGFSSTHTLSKMHLNVVVSVAQISCKYIQTWFLSIVIFYCHFLHFFCVKSLHFWLISKIKIHLNVVFYPFTLFPQIHLNVVKKPSKRGRKYI